VYAELREVWNELTGPGGSFEVAEFELGGRSLRTYANAAPSLRELWLGSAAHAEKDYLVYGDERLTYAQAHQQAAALAGWLTTQGVGPGDRVAIAMRNYPEWMLAYWSVVSMGATVVGMNAWWVADELLYAVNDSTPRVMICDAERLERFRAVRDQAPPVTLVGVRIEGDLPGDVVPWQAVVSGAKGLPDASIDPDSDACVFYTSGTTGHPKGARLTHRGCTANVMSLAFWASASALAARRARGNAPSGSAPSPVSALLGTPLFHVTANNCIAQPTTAVGGKLVHMYKWDAGEALRLIERERVTNIAAVPVMSRELITHPDFEKTDTTSLKTLGGGGAPMQPDLVEKIERSSKDRRPQTGYGMTETSGIITANSADFFVGKPGSAGPAMPCFETRCVDEDGKDVPAGSPGELWVRGAQIIRGYLNRPDATEESITDGWLHTGDIARIDEDGFIFLVDRAKDMVLRGGENVYCSEVEAAVFDHEEVVECAAFAVPDDRMGEEVGIAVVLREAGALDADALREHCASRLAKYKIPRFIWFLEEALPRNANGKYMKRELRDTLPLGDAQ
jgi:long-chain acyl-CoA synthetase